MHIDTTTRGRKTDEALEIISRLWAGEALDFAGRHFRLSKASISPLPVQPDLPMWIGGSSEAAIRRTARIGTGWQAGPETPEVVGEVIAGIKAGLLETGRTIEEDHYGAAFAFRFGGPDDPGVAKDGALSRSDGARSAGYVRDGRCGGDPAAVERLCRSGGLEVYPAAGRRWGCGYAGADAAAGRGGAAAGCGTVAEAAEGGGLGGAAFRQGRLGIGSSLRRSAPVVSP